MGNLGDFTFRAVDVLKNVDIIICEDTRISSRLLRHYEISKPMKSYNAHNESLDGVHRWIENLFQQNSQIALITDSGTPCISDPGVKLVDYCHKNNITIIPLPGASVLPVSLSVSGFWGKNSLFYGFLPNKKGKRKREMERLLNEEKKVIVFYESPYRLLHLFETLRELNPDIPVCMCKELTKQYEQILRGSAKELLEHLQAVKTIKGEYAVVLDNSNGANVELEDEDDE